MNSGAKGKGVKTLQHTLNSFCHKQKLKADGLYGPKTKAAVKRVSYSNLNYLIILTSLLYCKPK